MTSTLQANHLFNNDPFSSAAFYGRPINGKFYTAEPTAAGPGFGNNIWLSDSHVDLGASRDYATRQSGKGRQPDLSILTGNTRNNHQPFVLPGDKRSPITSENGVQRRSGSSSAHSRSQNESTLPTPKSWTSFPENAFQKADENQDQQVRRGVGFSTQPYQKRKNAWPTAKEFTPSATANQARTAHTLMFEQPKKSFNLSNMSQSVNGRGNSLQTIWSQSEKSTFQGQVPHQSGFRPVLSNTASFSNSFDRSGFVTSDRRNVVPADDGISEGLGKFGLNQHVPCHGSYPWNPYGPDTSHAARHGQDKEQYHRIADRQYTEAWSQNTYAREHSLNIAGNNYVQQIWDKTNIQPVSSAGSGGHQNDSFSKAVFAYGSQPLTAMVQPYPRVGLQYDTCGPPELQQYPSQPHNGIRHTTNPNSTFDGRSDAHVYDPLVDLPYVTHDSAIERQPESTQIYRSPLLEDFHINGKTKKYELKDIYDHIVEFSGDQLGSRFIQHKLEIANSDDKERVFNEIARDSRQLMTDVFGNYVIQKMFEHGNQRQKKVLASHMKGHIYALSTQTYGCRVVQKALEHVLTDQQATLIKELDGCVLKVVENQNGNHVIQKAVEMIPGEHIQFIVDAHRGHVHYLSKHPYGCRVIQRMLEHCQAPAKRQILDELHMNISDLIQDAFGNYVVQHVIVNGEQQDRKPVIDKVQGKLLENAMHKFASNVVEKALDYAEEEQCRVMLKKLTARDENGQSQVIKLLSHQYGNYVIQKSAAHLTGHTLDLLIEEMEQYLMQLRRVSTGKQVLALETSIREARQRSNSQRYDMGVPNAPQGPRRAGIVVR